MPQVQEQVSSDQNNANTTPLEAKIIFRQMHKGAMRLSKLAATTGASLHHHQSHDHTQPQAITAEGLPQGNGCGDLLGGAGHTGSGGHCTAG